MAPEAPEIPTTIRRVIRPSRRSGSCPGPRPVRARAPSPSAPPASARGNPRGRGPGAPARRADRPLPVPPAAPRRRPSRSGRVSLGSFLGCPVPHAHVATAIAKQCVDLPVVRDGADDFADEQDVITGRALLSHLAPEHRDTPFHCRRRETGLLDDRDLESGELVGPLGRLARGNRELLL